MNEFKNSLIKTLGVTYLHFISIILLLIPSIFAFSTLMDSVQYLNTDSSWKFYFALAGFLIFLGMLLIAVFGLIFKKEIVQFIRAIGEVTFNK